MPSKKPNQKLDLTHLATSRPTAPRAPEKPKPSPSDTPVESSTTPAAQEEPAPTPVEEAPTDSRQWERRPQRPQVKPLKTLAQATNEAAEVFKPGDKIQAKAPWGTIAIAEITTLYEDESGNAWAQYIPAEPLPDKWSWLGGCTRAVLLKKA